MRRAFLGVMAASSLLTRLAVPVLRFWGHLNDASMKQLFLLASVVWFVASALWSARTTKP